MQVKYGLLVDGTKESALKTEKHFRNQKRAGASCHSEFAQLFSKGFNFPWGLKKTMRKDYFRGEVCAVKS